MAMLRIHIKNLCLWRKTEKLMGFYHYPETISKKSLTVYLKFGKHLSEHSFWCK
jgi:hypothetical protein